MDDSGRGPFRSPDEPTRVRIDGCGEVRMAQRLPATCASIDVDFTHHRFDMYDPVFWDNGAIDIVPGIIGIIPGIMGIPAGMMAIPGVRALAERIPVGLKRLSLNLSHCDIETRSVRAIAERLPAGLSRLSLDFRGARISEDRGAWVAVAEGLPEDSRPLALTHALEETFTHLLGIEIPAYDPAVSSHA